jgi:WD40 repeat protein
MANVSFLVGIDEYEDPKLPNFSKSISANDVEALCAVLRSPDSQYSQPQPKFKLSSRQIFYTELKKSLTDFLSIPDHTDVLIYFSGHGYQVGEESKGYLATSDSRLLVDSGSGKFVRQENGLSFEELADLIVQAQHLKSLVLLIDACHSGGALIADSLTNALLKLSQSSFKSKVSDKTFRYCIIPSSLSSEESHTEDGMGAFTKVLIDELTCRDFGPMTTEILAKRLEENFKPSSQQTIKPGLAGYSIQLMNYPFTGVNPFPQEPIYNDGTKILKNPYQGLKAFEEKSHEFFFGRSKFIDRILEQMEPTESGKSVTAFVPIIGASGSGKSSVVKAGLFPELRKRGQWKLAVCKPGIRPLDNLISALKTVFFLKSDSNSEILEEFRAEWDLFQTDRSLSAFQGLLSKVPAGNSKYLILVDQFEELFTLVSQSEDADERNLALNDQKTFIDIITSVEKPLHIVITMRADFLESCLSYDSLQEMIQSYALYIPALRGQDLRDAIEKPAKRQGVEVETTLVDRLEQEVVGEPGSLPLMEFALAQLWEQQYDADEKLKSLRLTVYETIGNAHRDRSVSGLKRVLDSHANEVYGFVDWQRQQSESRTEQEQEWIRRVFLQLIRSGIDAKDTRQRQIKRTLLKIAGQGDEHDGAKQVLDDLIQDLVDARLLVTGAPEETRSERQIEEMSEEESRRWAEENTVVDLAHEALIDGWQLFVDWRKKVQSLLRLRERIESARKQWVEQEYGDGNLMTRGLLAQVEQVSWQSLRPFLRSDADAEFYEKSKNFVEQQDSYEKRRNDELQRSLTEAELQLDSGRLERLIATERTPPSEKIWTLAIQITGKNREQAPNKIMSCVQDCLRQAADHAISSISYGSTASLESVAFSPDGQYIVSGGDELRLWGFNKISIGILFQFQGIDHCQIRTVAFSPDGQYVVSGGNELRLWDINGVPIRSSFRIDYGHITSVAFSPDGQSIAIGSYDTGLRLAKPDGTPIGNYFVESSMIDSVAFSPDGQSIVGGGENGKLMLWKLDGTSIGNPFQGHTSAVTSVAFSPDGQTIISSSDDTTLRLWKLDGTSIGNPFQGHTSAVTSVKFSLDGQTIVSVSRDKTLRLWNLNGTEVCTPFQKCIRALSPNGQTIISGSDDTTLRLWKLDGTPVGNPFQGHTSAVTHVAFSPDGQTIISGSGDKTLRLWKLDGTPIGNPFQGHTSAVTSVAFSPDGQTIISGSDDTTLRLWKLDGTPIGNPFQGHTSAVTSVAFSPDDQTIISGSNDTTLRLWKLDGTPIGNPFQGHTSAVTSVAFSLDGQTIVSSSDDTTLRLWKLDGTPVGNPFQGHTSAVTSVAFSPDGQTIISGSNDTTLRLWSLDGTPIGTALKGHTEAIVFAAFSPDGQTIISSSNDCTLRVWKLNINTFIAPFQCDTHDITSVAFSPDGQTIVSGSDDTTLRLWDLDGTPIGQPFRGHTAPVKAIAFSPDSQTIISGSDDTTLRLWNLSGTPASNPFQGHTSSVDFVAFSPDGQTIISGSRYRMDGLRLWSLSGTPVGNSFQGFFYGAAFSPDGQLIIIGNADNIIGCWSLDGTLIGNPFNGYTGIAQSISLSPDGQTIIIGNADKTLRLWSLDGTLICVPFTGHTGWIQSIAFSPDGQIISSCSDDQTLRLWCTDGTPIGSPTPIPYRSDSPSSSYKSLVFSPDGQSILVGLNLLKNTGWRSWLKTCCDRLNNDWTHDPKLTACKTCSIEYGVLAIEAGDFDKALTCFEKAIACETLLLIETKETKEKRPFKPGDLIDAAKAKAAPYLQKHGQFLVRTGNHQQAEKCFALAREYSPPGTFPQTTTPTTVI